MKDRETRGAEAGASEDKRLLWTDTAENTEARRVPSTKVAACMVALSRDPQEMYSVLCGKAQNIENMNVLKKFLKYILLLRHSNDQL